MPVTQDLAKLEDDFLSGRNALAYIPLGHALRKAKQYGKALDICQKGLAKDPTSVAGRTLLVRLLADLGRYEEALEEGKKSPTAASSMGMQTEMLRCLVKLRRFEEAEDALDLLVVRNPLDPQVQALSAQLRELRRSMRDSSADSAVAPRPARLAPAVYTNAQIMDILKQEMSPLAEIKSCAVISLKADAPALEGDPITAEAAYAIWKDASGACQELDCGKVKMGFVETPRLHLIVLVRGTVLVSLGMQPTLNFGKVFHRLQVVVNQLLPDPQTPKPLAARSS